MSGPTFAQDHHRPANTDNPEGWWHSAAVLPHQPEHTPGMERAFLDRRADYSLVPVQAMLAVNQPGDAYEREADRMAEAVLRSPSSEAAGIANIHPRPSGIVQQRVPETAAPLGMPYVPSHLISSPGRSLDPQVRSFMEPRFGVDFASVRVHTDPEAQQLSRSLGASAFTHRNHIYFGPGYAPQTDTLTAHELAHVIQQTNRPSAAMPGIQRVVELRPPGRGEASAFDRRQELIDRLNGLSVAIQYRLDGRRIVYDLVDEAALTHFDRQMRGFIDRAEVAPLRLITSAGRVQGGGGTFVPLLIDSFTAGYVDLEDLLASNDLSFQMNLIHILVERFAVRNYARRIGTAFSLAEFNRAHQAGINAEAEFLREAIGDPTLRFNYEETRPNGTLVFAFRSAEGYRIFHVFRRGGAHLRGGDLFAQTRDGRRLTIDELIAERAAAAEPAGP